MGCNKPVSPNSSKGCVCEVVRAILDIQNQSVRDDCSRCTTNCFLEPLGGIVSPGRSNVDTRVFMLLTKFGTPFVATFSADDCMDCASVFFRVEDVFDDCCATLRVLKPLDRGGDVVDLLNSEGTAVSLRSICDVTNYAVTDSCITVDLNCFCAVQCVADVNLGICN